MSKKTAATTPQSEAFKAWYDSNGAAYNEARRQKYQTDPGRRDKARFQAAEYRQAVKKTGKLPELRDGLYTTSHLAAILRVSAQTVRNWESKGMIPKANQPGKHRLYTPEQVRLLLQLTKIPLKTEDDQIKFDHFRAEVSQRWGE